VRREDCGDYLPLWGRKVAAARLWGQAVVLVLAASALATGRLRRQAVGTRLDSSRCQTVLPRLRARLASRPAVTVMPT
jgi:hypothetical protein